MVLTKKYRYIFFIVIFSLFFSTISFSAKIESKLNIEDLIFEKIQKNLGINIYYGKKSGTIITGFIFENISVVKNGKEFMYIKKARWIPEIKNIKNIFSILYSFSIYLENPVLYLDKKNKNEDISELSNYKDFLKNIKNYNIKLKIKNGRIDIIKYPSIYIDGTLEWNKLLYFRSVKLRIGKGKAYVEGGIDPYFNKKDASCSIFLDNIPSLIPYYYRGNVDFKGKILSDNGHPLIRGALTLKNGAIYIKKGSSINRFFLNPYLDLFVKLDKNVTIKSGLSYEFKGGGLFKIGSSLKIPKIIGNFIIDSGRILFGNKYFRVITGKIEFTEFRYLDPLLDIKTQGNVDGIKIFATISGFARESKVKLESIPPFSQRELSLIIALGKRIEDYEGKSIDEFLTGESLSFAFNVLSLRFMNSLNGIGREYLGLDTFTLEPSFEAYNNDTIRTKWLLKLGKYIGEDFYIKYERILTPYTDDVFGFEFYPAKGLSFEFSVDRKNNIQLELIYEYTF